MDAISNSATEETLELSNNFEIKRPSTQNASDTEEIIQNNGIHVDTDIAIIDNSSKDSEETSNTDAHETSSVLEKVSNDIDSCTEQKENEILEDIKEVYVSQNGVENVVNDSNYIQNDQQSKSFEKAGYTVHHSNEYTSEMKFLTENKVSECISEPLVISDDSDLKTPCYTYFSESKLTSNNFSLNSLNSVQQKLSISPQSEIKVHFASPLSVLHEYDEFSECSVQNSIDLMDNENFVEQNESLVNYDKEQQGSVGNLSQIQNSFTDDTKASLINHVNDQSLYISNCNSDSGKQSHDQENSCTTSKSAREENVINILSEVNLGKENGVIRDFALSINESEVTYSKIGLGESVRVCDTDMESNEVIHNEVRDILNELVDKCCQVSSDTEICLHNDQSIAVESIKKIKDNEENSLLDYQVNFSEVKEYEVGDDFANLPTEKSNEKHENLSCSEGNHKKELMDVFNSASCSIDHLIQEPEIALYADSALKDSQLSVVTCHSSLEGEMPCNGNVDDKINGVNEKESTGKQHVRNSIYANSHDKCTDFTCVSNISNYNDESESIIQLAINDTGCEFSEEPSHNKLQEGTNLYMNPKSLEKSYCKLSASNDFEETHSSSHGNENITNSRLTSVKTDQEVKEEISQCVEGHVEIQICNSTSLDLPTFSTSNHENIELGSKHLNGSLKRNIHMANSNLREEELNLTDKETPAKCIKPDVLEEHQTLSANSKIGTKNTDMNDEQILDSSKYQYSLEQDNLENEKDKVKDGIPSYTFKTVTSLQNGPLQSNLKSGTISNIIHLDNERERDIDDFVSTSEFHSSQSSDKKTCETTNVGNDLQRFQDMLDTPVNAKEDYQSPCKLQKYDIIDCHLSGGYSTRRMDQAVPGVEISTEVMNIEVEDNDTFYGQNSMLQKTSEDNGAKKQCFKWKYTPSLDLESTVFLNDEDQSLTIPPLHTCHKPVRVGLSKKQKVKSLHSRFLCQK